MEVVRTGSVLHDHQDYSDHNDKIITWGLLVAEKNYVTDLLRLTFKKCDEGSLAQHMTKKEERMPKMLLVHRMMLLTIMVNQDIQMEMQQMYTNVLLSPAAKDMEELSSAMSRLTICDDGGRIESEMDQM